MKDKKKDKNENQNEGEQLNSSADSEQENTPTEILTEPKKDYELEDKRESKEILKLEYFSKEDLSKQVKSLEENLKKCDDSLKKILEEKDKAKNQLIHLQAEFENAQKRWDKSRQDIRTQYTASVLKNFLSLYDSFKKAIESDPENENLKTFFNQFLNIFKTYKAEPIQIKINDPFDYSLHEALTTLEKDDIPENSIVDIIQDGWKIGKEVLRYAKVVISKKPKPPEPEKEEKEEKEPEQPEEQESETDSDINES